MSTHAILSPSSAHRWMACPGSVSLERDIPNVGSSYAAEGTAAHALAELCLVLGSETKDHIGTIVEGYEVTEEMAEHIQWYIDTVNEYSQGNEILVEQKLPISQITDEAGATGTSDAVILDEAMNEVVVLDLKYGMGVAVGAENNEQGMMYALGALTKYGAQFDIRRVRIVILQPRTSRTPSEWVIDVDELIAWGETVTACAEMTRAAIPEFQAGAKQCKFCRAKAICPALSTLVADEFEVIPEPKTASTDDIGGALSKLDLIEDWCKAIRARAESELLLGRPVKGYKLVQGKRGNRAWSSDEAAITAFKSFRLKIEEMYNLKLISPTQAEKLLADTPRRWDKMAALVTQAEGKPTVAPESDKRAALVIQDVEAAFDDLDSLI